MNYKQIQDVFPDIKEWRSPSKIKWRVFAIEKNIDSDASIVLAKMAELFEAAYPLDALQWMYLIHDPKQRVNIIEGYKRLIEDFSTGKLVYHEEEAE